MNTPRLLSKQPHASQAAAHRTHVPERLLSTIQESKRQRDPPKNPKPLNLHVGCERWRCVPLSSAERRRQAHGNCLMDGAQLKAGRRGASAPHIPACLCNQRAKGHFLWRGRRSADEEHGALSRPLPGYHGDGPAADPAAPLSRSGA
ncbi:hypothetical protein AAFF_G00248850 [Aldrovandia affinis]|uniref:Uncharacterized protein n=1 Tax=Aldrovandia affinis TaxID=143900 RepID=A0AAD7RFV3_9TELE|nr:hypothetical protein AAFF_G00248850 [Aldrovandia affinis]